MKNNEIKVDRNPNNGKVTVYIYSDIFRMTVKFKYNSEYQKSDDQYVSQAKKDLDSHEQRSMSSDMSKFGF